MIADPRPYPAMKDSGVPPLGEVPEHWQIRRNGSLFQQRNQTGFAELPILEVSLITGVRVRNLDSAGRKQIMSDLAGYKRARRGDLAYNMMRMWQGAVGAAPVDGLVSPAYVVARPNPGTASEFYSRLFRTDAYMAEVDKYSHGIVKDRNRLYWDQFKQMPSPVPPAEEQAAIVRFLDHVDRRIRRYIRAKQKLITLLEEQKQAIIHRAVTRGLDPTDSPQAILNAGHPAGGPKGEGGNRTSNVRLKSSGVEWLGDVPEHWEVLPLCAIARPRKLTNQPHRELLSVYLGRGVIPFTAVEEKRTNPTSEDLSKYQVVEPGDFVLNNQQAWRGSVGVSRYEGIVSPAYLVLALDGRLHQEFADRLLSDRAMVAQYLVCSKGVGSIQRNLYWPHLRRAAILVPPKAEQAAIVRFLLEATASLGAIIARTSREIDLVRELRTRLIADVVTGKLDVREAAARLSEEDDLAGLDDHDHHHGVVADDGNDDDDEPRDSAGIEDHDGHDGDADSEEESW